MSFLLLHSFYYSVIWIMKLLDELYQERTALAINKYVAEKSFIFQCYIHTLEIQCMGSSILSLRQNSTSGVLLSFSGASTIQWNFMCVPVLKETYVDMLFQIHSIFPSYLFERKRVCTWSKSNEKTFPSFGRALLALGNLVTFSASSDTRQHHLHSRGARRDLIILSQGVACPWGGRILCSRLWMPFL